MENSLDETIRSTFLEFRTDLQKTPRSEEGKVSDLIGKALSLTSISRDPTYEEFAFYKTARGKVAETKDTLADLETIVSAIASVALDLERTVETLEKDFQAMTGIERREYLQSAAYCQLKENGEIDSKAIATVATRIQNLLFQRVKDSYLRPFTSFEVFAEHRTKINQLYNRCVDLQNRHARCIRRIEVGSLFASTTLVSKVDSAISRNPYPFSISFGLAIMGLGAYGLSVLGKDAYLPLAYGLGALAAAAPWIMG